MTYILDGVSVSQLAIRRLEKINNTVIRLRPLVDSYAGFDPNTTALQPLIDDIDQLFDFSEQLALSNIEHFIHVHRSKIFFVAI